MALTHGLLRALGGVGLVFALGCGSTDTTDQPPSNWEEERALKVEECLLHLNNENRSERWRGALVEIGVKSEEDRRFLLERVAESYKQSIASGGAGAGALRPPGRRRVMELLGRLPPNPTGRELLSQGLNDLLEVRVAAAEGLAGWGDESAIPVLLRTALEVEEDHPARQVTLQGLRRLASPERRGLFLNALSSDVRELIKPIVLATFPEPGEERALALREIAAAHENPYARAFAFEILVEAQDPEVVDLARAALASDDPVVRPAALTALGTAGGDDTVEELEKRLSEDSQNAEQVARGLFASGTLPALEAALRVLEDSTLQPKTRAAVCTGFLQRMRDAGAPAPYRGQDALEMALTALRGTLGEHDEQLILAAVRALGRIGDRDADAEPLLALLVDPSPRVALAIVAALGHLGGEFAAAKLVQLVEADPDLRDPASQSLGSFSDPRDIPMDTLVDLLASEDIAVRAAAHQALVRVSGTQDPRGFDPADPPVERDRGMDQWRSWWAARRN